MSSVSIMSKAEAKLVVSPSCSLYLLASEWLLWQHRFDIITWKMTVAINIGSMCNMNKALICGFSKIWIPNVIIFLCSVLFLSPMFAFSFQFLFRQLPAAKPSTPISSKISSSSLGCPYRSLSTRPIWRAASHPHSTTWALIGKHTVASNLHVLTI